MGHSGVTDSGFEFRKFLYRYSAVITIIVWNFIVLMLISSSDAGLRWGEMLELWVPSGAGSLSGKIIAYTIRLISYTFIHSGAGHLLWNMASLALFGGIIAPYLGFRRFNILYFGSGIAGGLAFIGIAAANESWSISALCGASAATLGIMAETIIMIYHGKIHLRSGFRIAAVIIAVAVILLTLSVGVTQQQIIAHLGGLSFGIIFGIISESSIGGSNRIDESEDKSGNKEMVSDQKIRREEILKRVRYSGYSSLTEEERKVIRNKQGEETSMINCGKS